MNQVTTETRNHNMIEDAIMHLSTEIHAYKTNGTKDIRTVLTILDEMSHAIHNGIALLMSMKHTNAAARIRASAATLNEAFRTDNVEEQEMFLTTAEALLNGVEL